MPVEFVGGDPLRQADRLAQEPRREPLKPTGIIRDHAPQHAERGWHIRLRAGYLAPSGGTHSNTAQSGCLQSAGDIMCALDSRVNHPHPRADHAGNPPLQHRVVRASQYQHARGMLHHWRKILLQRQMNQRVGFVSAIFDDRCQQGRRLHEDAGVVPSPNDGAHVCLGADSGFGRQNADDRSLGGAGSLDRRAGTGSITPLIERSGNAAVNAGNANAVAVLHAITMCFGCTRWRRYAII